MTSGKKKRSFVTKRLVFHFLWIVIVWRLAIAIGFLDFKGFVLSEWLNPVTWIGPVIVATATVFGWWRYYKKGEYPFED